LREVIGSTDRAAPERKGKILPLGEEQNRVVGETKLSPKIENTLLLSSKKVASTALASNERAAAMDGRKNRKRIIGYIAVGM
jgi:hypothetical protein